MLACTRAGGSAPHLQVRLDGLVLRVERRHVGHEVLDDLHVRQRVDLVRLRAGEGAVPLAGAGARRRGRGGRTLATSFLSMYVRHASPFVPSMFIAHEPQMPSRQELRRAEGAGESLGGGRPASPPTPSTHRRKVRVGSCSFLILSRASKSIGPHWSRSTAYVAMCGFCGGQGEDGKRRPRWPKRRPPRPQLASPAWSGFHR